MTTDEVIDRLRGRHSAVAQNGVRVFVGQWTTIREWRGIDLLAIAAASSPQPSIGVRNPRVGYEVKVSRTDYRREILRPHKRKLAVEWCNAFYFAVPRGLLTEEELAYRPPPELDDWEAFEREDCRYSLGGPDDPGWTEPGELGRCYRGVRSRVRPYPEGTAEEIECDGCAGKGYAALSLAERIAPTLWIPSDVGLIVVDGRGCQVARRAPLRRDVPGMEPGELAAFARWVSAHPDPRHATLQGRSGIDLAAAS